MVVDFLTVAQKSGVSESTTAPFFDAIDFSIYGKITADYPANSRLISIFLEICRRNNIPQNKMNEFLSQIDCHALGIQISDWE